MTTVLSLIALTPNKLGSYEEFEVLLARRMRLLGWRSVKIFNDSPKGDLLNAILDTGCELNTLPQHFSKISSMLHAAALFRNFKPDLLHVSFHPMTTPLSILARTCGVKKIIFTDHFSGMPPLNSAPKELFRSIRNKFSMFPINKFIAVSRFVAHRLETRSGVSPHKIRVIYNGINTQRFHNKTDRALIRESLGVPFGDFLFIAVAHLIKSKGIHHFLDAGKILLAKGLNVSFVIVGTGPELDKLQDQASALNMTPKVHFVGLRNDVNLLMGSADALVCPSLWDEAFGLVNAEAMLCGIPVIASRVGGIPELITDRKTGILVAPGNTSELANAMLQIVANQEQARIMGSVAQEEALRRFSLERMVEDTITIYQEVLNRRELIHLTGT